MGARFERPAACDGCPAHSWAVGFVPPVGPQDARVAWVGQGPGEQEAEFGVPFYENAPSGARLTKWMHYSGWQRNEQAIGNIVQCWLPEGRDAGRPYGNRQPTRAEAAACWTRHVGPWLTSLPRLEHVITIGAPATRWLRGLGWDAGAERFVGTTEQINLPALETSP